MIQKIKNFDLKKLLYKEFELLKLQYELFWENDILTRASSLAFSTIFSIVPVLAVAFLFFKLFGGKDVFLQKIKPYIYSFLAPGISKSFSGYIDSFLDSATIDALGGIGFILLSFGVYSILSSIESSFNKIWQVSEQRSYFRRFKLYWLIITLSPFAFLFSFSYIMDLTSRLDQYILGLYISYVIFRAFTPIITLAFFILLIKIIPNCHVKTKYAFFGAITGAFFYFITKNYFTHYTVKAVSYNLIYGSLATLTLFMMWIYWVWIIVLVGVQSAFARQNYNYLMQKKEYEKIGSLEQISVLLVIIIKMIKEHLDLKVNTSVLDYSKELNLPLELVKKSFELLEENQIVKSTKTFPEIYILNKSLNLITIKSIIEVVNKSNFNINKYDLPKEILSIMDEYNKKSSNNIDKSIINLL